MMGRGQGMEKKGKGQLVELEEAVSRSFLTRLLP